MAVVGNAFQYEIDESVDDTNFVTTTIHCHGRLLAQNVGEIRALVNPLLERGGRTVLDFADLEQLDSTALGALVGLKVSAVKRGLCVLELVNLTPRVRELLSITNLLSLLAPKS